MPLPFAFLSVILIWSTTPLATEWSAQGAGFSFAVLSRMALGTMLCLILLALLLGHTLNHEEILPQVWLGAMCILLGLAVHRWGTQLVLRLSQ